MIKINLLPVRAAKKKETFMNEIYVGILVLVLALAGVGWRAISRKAEISRLKNEITDRKKELEDLKETVKKVEEFEAKKQVLEQKIALIVDLEQGRDRFIQIIDQISQVIPGGLWVANLSFKGGKGASKQANTISLRGLAYEKEDVGNFIANLNSRKDFIKEARLLNLASARGGGGATGVTYSYDVILVPKVEEKALAEPETKGRKKK